jgi:hypothetical protein
VFKEALQKATAALDSLRVPYALIGGLAVDAYGGTRLTKDIDFLIDWPISDAKSLAQSLTRSGLPAEARRGDIDDPVPGVIRIGISVGEATIRCDLLFPIQAWHRDAVRAASHVQLKGLRLPIVQPGHLFLLKLEAGGTLDLYDAAQLFYLQSTEERARWKQLASGHRLSRAFKECLKFLPRIAPARP